MAVIRYSRLRHLILTLADLGLVILAACGVQHQNPAVVTISALLLALASLGFLLICREWLSPSSIELDGLRAIVSWGNWQVAGYVRSISQTKQRPRKLVLILGDAKAALTPVGPLFIAAGFILQPLLRLLLPAPLSRLYHLDKRRLLAVQSDGTARAELSFPLIFFGRRRIAHVLKCNME